MTETTEKWWNRKPFGRTGDEKNEMEENMLSVSSVRSNWIEQSRRDGVVIYRTPAGLFEVEEKSDGTIIRLQRIGD